MSLLRVRELEAQLARSVEKIAELELAIQQRGNPVAEVYYGNYGGRTRGIGFVSIRSLVSTEKLPPPGTLLYAYLMNYECDSHVPLERNHHHIASACRPKNDGTEVRMNFDGFDLVIRGGYQPAERQWFNPMKGIGHPGCDEDFEVTEVYLVDSAIDVIELFDADALSLAVLEHMRQEREVCEPEAT